MRTFVFLGLLVVTVSFARAAPVPAGEPINFEVRFADQITLDGFGLAPVGRRLYIDPRGFVAVDNRLAEDIEPQPLGEALGGWLIAPFWAELDGGDCPEGPANRVEKYTDAAGGVVAVIWREVLGADCDATRAATFAVVITRRAGGGAVIELRYQALPTGRVAHPPRAGVVLGEVTVELFPDGEDAPSDRALALLSGGSERVSRDEHAAGDGRAIGTVKVPGVWVVELDGQGALVGDVDADGVRGGDNCDQVVNPLQLDTDRDEDGDACDDDDDADGLRDPRDNCPLRKNPDQRDADGDGRGDVCDDSDGDGLFDADDLCRTVPDADRLDLDADGIGDACDADIDGDGLLQGQRLVDDPCPYIAGGRGDSDGDGIGDACDLRPRTFCPAKSCPFDRDSDGDRIPDVVDLCRSVRDPRQDDSDGDGLGDACDPDLDGDGVLDLYQPCFHCVDRTPRRIVIPDLPFAPGGP